MAIFRMFRDSALELKNLRCLTVTAVLIALNLALKSVTIMITDDLKISFSYLALAAIGMLFGPTVSFMAGTITDILGLLISQQMSAFNPLFTLVEAIGAMLYGLFLYRLVPIKFTKETFKPQVDPQVAQMSGINAKLASLMLIISAFIMQWIFNYDSIFTVYVVVFAILYGLVLYKLAALPWKQLLRVAGAKLSVAIVCNIVLTPAVMVITGIWAPEVVMPVKIPVRLLKNAIQCPVDIVLLMIILFPIMAAYNRVFKNSVPAKNKKAAANS